MAVVMALVVVAPRRLMLPVRPLCIMVWKYAGTCIAIVGYRLSVLGLRHSGNSGRRAPADPTGPMNKSIEAPMDDFYKRVRFIRPDESHVHTTYLNMRISIISIIIPFAIFFCRERRSRRVENG